MLPCQMRELVSWLKAAFSILVESQSSCILHDVCVATVESHLMSQSLTPAHYSIYIFFSKGYYDELEKEVRGNRWSEVSVFSASHFKFPCRSLRDIVEGIISLHPSPFTTKLFARIFPTILFISVVFLIQLIGIA